MSNLATIMRIPTNTIQWWRSWLGGNLSLKISTIITVTIKGNIFSVCYFFPLHARGRRPNSTRAIESNHGRKNGLTHFARTGWDERLNQKCGCEILLTYDLRSSTPQSPVVQEAGLISGIRNRVGTLNCAQAYLCTQSQKSNLVEILAS